MVQDYFVIKLSDIDTLNNEDTYAALTAMQRLDTLMPSREGVFIEKHWPIYEYIQDILAEEAGNKAP